MGLKSHSSRNKWNHRYNLEYDGKTGFQRELWRSVSIWKNTTIRVKFDKYCHSKMFTHRSQLADCVQRPVQEQLITIQSYIHKDNDYSLHRNSILVWYRQTIGFMWARLQWRIIGQKPFNKLPLLKSRATWNVGMFPNTGCNQTWMMNIIWLEILVYSYAGLCTPSAVALVVLAQWP